MHVVFVHGTGVREPGFTETFNSISVGLKTALPGVTMHRCYWAEKHGSNIGAGQSVPLYAQSMGVQAAPPENGDIYEWSLLLDDPLIELRLLAVHTGASAGGTPGITPATILRGQLRRLLDGPVGPFPGLDADDQQMLTTSVMNLLGMKGLDTSIAVGVHLAPSGANLLDAVRLLASRAIVAGWIRLLLDEGSPPPIAVTRDSLVDAIFSQLGGGKVQTMGIGKSLLNVALAPVKIMLKTVVVDPSMRVAMWGSRAFRHSIANAATPAAGDILLYQTRGKPIRDFILDTAAAVGEPVVLLAHSLGGIACIDLLLEGERPFIKGVITAGSQAPYLYEIGALSKLERDKQVPPHMPPWLNFYDKNDLLSFVAEPLMKAKNKVTDVEVCSGQPFPASHGAYWSNPDVWKACADFIREL